MLNDWEFGHLDIFNYKNCNPNHQKIKYLDFIKEYHDKLSGDLCEIGVYKGSFLLSTALFLKEIGSKKKVYGFDSFEGFPPVFDDKDDASKFESLFKENRITETHYADIKKRLRYVEALDKKSIQSGRITSVNNNFELNSLEVLEKKIEILELDNIILVPGAFSETMSNKHQNSLLNNDLSFLGAWFDCDIYNSYKTSLPFIWEKMVFGGYLYIDEYYSLKFPGCRFAVDEFFKDKSQKLKFHQNDQNDFERWYVIK